MRVSNSNHNKRKIIPNDIQVSRGYTIEVFAKELTNPINMIFTPTEEIFLASGKSR